jgi:serine/threonine protein kinase
MSQSATKNEFCPRCGAKLEGGSLADICPKCLLAEVALGDETASQPRRWTPPSVSAIAAAFPQLDIVELIGAGGMGVVYKARQKSLDRFVALKILAPEYAANQDFAQRFAREAKVLAEVTHPNIVAVHDFGCNEGLYFLMMEFVDGVNLRQAMQAAKLTPQQALRIIPPICEALQFAHERGVVHRDIKPENVLLDRLGTVKIADFGIARLLRVADRLSDGSSDATQAMSDASAVNLTGQSAIGTPGYMAPEQLTSPDSVDERADIYSLGVVLYEMLTGELPGNALTPPSRKVEVDVRLDQVVLRALDVRPELRFTTAHDFQTEIESIANETASTSAMKASANQRSHAGLRSMIRSSKCHISNRTELATFLGKVLLWRKNGFIEIDQEAIYLSQVGPNRVIPIAAITNVSLGIYPVLTNPWGLNFIYIEWSQNGLTDHVIMSPNEFVFGTPSQFNRIVLDWYNSIRDQAQAATGKSPSTSSAKDLLPKFKWFEPVVAMHPVTITVSLIAIYFLLYVADLSVFWKPLPLLLTAAIAIPILFPLIFRSRNNPDNPKYDPLRFDDRLRFWQNAILIGSGIIFMTGFATVAAVYFIRLHEPSPPVRVTTVEQPRQDTPEPTIESSK